MAKHFDTIYPALHLKQPQISAWLKHEATWREEHERSVTGADRSVKRVRQTQHPEVTEMLELWISKALAEKVLLTGEVLRQKWKKFAALVGVPEDEQLGLSEGWLSRFKARTGLKELKRHGEAASAAADVVDKERLRIQELMKEHGYRLRDIFNCDETALFYAYVFLFVCKPRPLV